MLVFAAFVLPWQWVALRAASGVLLVFFAVAVISRLPARSIVSDMVEIVLLVGGLRGVLFPASQGIAHLGVVSIVLFVVAGTVFAIPTAGEIPIVQGLRCATSGSP